VQIITKEEALSGASFNPETVRSMLNILILSFDSFRTQNKNKEGRKVYQENGSLLNFQAQYPVTKVIEDADTSSLAQTLNNLNPLIVIDESHNADTDLSIDMLKNLNPAFILELTATPKDRSNIISYVNALVLKKDNMVKLPVIVYNNHDANDVITTAITLREKLEAAACKEETETGNYIRPIVLFQAEPQTGKETLTFAKLKEKLIAYGLPSEQIAIKTADINELKSVALNNRDCPIRYILTVNALKEGWDCPFAYILAALSNRSSPINVEQILGRILRQPYVKSHRNHLLNMSYVLTSQAKFLDTLPNIINGLQRAGFSRDDYRVKQEQLNGETPKSPKKQSGDEPALDFIDTITPSASTPNTSSSVDEVINISLNTENQFTATLDEIERSNSAADSLSFPNELRGFQKMNRIRAAYKEIAGAIKLPRFYEKAEAGIFDALEGADKLVSKVSLLKGFKLSTQASDISLDGTGDDIYKIDIDVSYSVAEPEPVYNALDESELKNFLKFVNALSPADQKREILARILNSFSRNDYLEDTDLQKYLKRIIDDLGPAQMDKVKQNPFSAAEKIKAKIKQLAEAYAKKQVLKLTDTGEIYQKETWPFPSAISPLETVIGMPNMLYEKEEKSNSFETKVINQVAQLDNILFWHRNIERKGFCLNGWLNHYPDFIIYTKKEKLILLETKGDDRDNSDSKEKLSLGKIWSSKAGDRFRYYMVFEQSSIPDAYKVDDFIANLKKL
jgi:type III restriction enzyme